MENATTAAPINPVNGTEDSGQTTDVVKTSLWVLRLAVLIICMVVAFPKNLQVISILHKHKSLRKVPHVLLGNLSIVGAIASGYYLPLYLFVSFMAERFFEAVPTWLCVARYSSNMFITSLQAYALVFMAIDRHDCVVRPFKRRIKTSNVWKIVKVAWLVAALVASAHLIISLGEAKGNCYGQQKTRTRSQTFTLIVGNANVFTTIITILVTFLRIVKKLRSSPFAESSQNRESHVTRFTYMVLFGFVFAWLPLTVFVPLNLAFRFKSPHVGEIKALFLAITNVTYAVNPFAHMSIIDAALRGRAKPPPPGRGQSREERPRAEAGQQPGDAEGTGADAGADTGTGTRSPQN